MKVAGAAGADRARGRGPLRRLLSGRAVLDAIVIAGLLVVLGSGFFMLAALVLLKGYDLRRGNAMKAFVLLVVGLQSLVVFADKGEVDWSAGIPLALGSAAGAYVARGWPRSTGPGCGSTASSCSWSSCPWCSCWS